jgi:predicted Zn-dependent protease
LARDPDNPALINTVEDLAHDRGDTAIALQLARRSRELQPDYYRLAVNEAQKLARTGNFAAAEVLLQETASTGAPRDLTAIARAVVELAIRTRRFEEGHRTLDSLIARRPGDTTLAVLRTWLVRQEGDVAGAEKDLRAILATHPTHTGALEELVSLLVKAGRTEEAAQASLTAAEHQPSNQANHLRAARAAEARADEAAAVKHYLAAGRSGPVTAALKVQLARNLTGLGRADDALLHLAWARRLSLLEGDPAVTASITDYINQQRALRP